MKELRHGKMTEEKIEKADEILKYTVDEREKVGYNKGKWPTEAK